MAFCTKCGGPIASGQDSCGNCGAARFGEGKPVASADSVKKSLTPIPLSPKSLWITLGVIGFFIAIIVASTMDSQDQKKTQEAASPATQEERKDSGSSVPSIEDPEQINQATSETARGNLALRRSWYLIAAPGPAPLSQWPRIAEFNSAAACDEQLESRVLKAKEQVLKAKEQVERDEMEGSPSVIDAYQHKVAVYRAQLAPMMYCIASDDPQLKSEEIQRRTTLWSDPW